MLQWDLAALGCVTQGCGGPRLVTSVLPGSHTLLGSVFPNPCEHGKGRKIRMGVGTVITSSEEEPGSASGEGHMVS